MAVQTRRLGLSDVVRDDQQVLRLRQGNVFQLGTPNGHRDSAAFVQIGTRGWIIWSRAQHSGTDLARRTGLQRLIAAQSPRGETIITTEAQIRRLGIAEFVVADLPRLRQLATGTGGLAGIGEDLGGGGLGELVMIIEGLE